MATIEIPAAKISFECPPGDTILRAGLRAGLGMAYECNVGSCGNCQFELLEGKVESLYPEAPGLNERMRQRNRHLGCQSLALTDCKIKLPMRDDYKSLILPARATGHLTAIENLTHDIREFRFRLDKGNRFLPGQYGLIGVPGVVGARAYSYCNNTADDDNWTGRTGFVHEAVKDILGASLPEHEIYFAGPPPMTEAVMKMAIENKVPVAQLHYDRFY